MRHGWDMAVWRWLCLHTMCDADADADAVNTTVAAPPGAHPEQLKLSSSSGLSMRVTSPCCVRTHADLYVCTSHARTDDDMCMPQ